MKKKLLLLLTVLLTTAVGYAQTTVTGRATESGDGSPAFVTVMVKGTNTAVSTDMDGRYSIRVENLNSAVLVFSGVGYATLEVPVNGRSVVNAQISLDAASLDEVVVIGYGTGQKLGTVVGSVATVTAAKIKDRPTANAMDALQGQVAGLQVYTSSGEPSSTSSMRLHGVGSLTSSNTPLYVLDGIPIDSGSFMAINPNDFESVTLLKDASSTAIYGSRAANGVLFITTKRGSANRPPVVNFRARYSVSSLADKSFYNSLMTSEERRSFWLETGYRTQAWVDQNRIDWPYDTRWVDYFYKDQTPAYEANLSIRGGGGTTTYYVSAGHTYTEGVTAKSFHSRSTARVNVDSRATDWMRFGTNVSLAYSQRNTNGWGSNSTVGGLFWLQLPYYTPYDPKTGEAYDYVPGANFYSPWYTADMYPVHNNDVQLNGSAFMELTPIKNLTIKSQIGIDAYDQLVDSKRLAAHIGAPRAGQSSQTFYRNYLITNTNTMEYKFSIADKHNFTVLFGQEFIDNDNHSFGGSGDGIEDDRLSLLSSAPANRSVSESHSQYAYFSLFGRVDYGLKDKYFFNLNVRNDESSRFGRENRSAMFYSGGAMWNVKREDFLSGITAISDLRLRASYGTTGNSAGIGNYANLATIGTNRYNDAVGWAISSAGNASLGWETHSKLTIAVDAEFFKKYRIGLEFYKRSTKDMLMSVPLPYSNGFDTFTSNVGRLGNTGIDVTLGLDFVKTTDWYVNFNTTFNYNANKVKELFYGLDRWTVANTGVQYVVGQPVSFYYPIFAGIDPADGMQMWYLPNDTDNSIETRDPNRTTKVFSEAALLQNTGKARYAPIAGGFGFDISYKGIRLNSYFTYVLGKTLINNDRYFSSNASNFASYNQHSEVWDYWKKPGDETTFPRYGEIVQFDTHLLENASFLRLKSLELSYELPQNVVSKTGVFKYVRVMASARNLFTVTKYTGPDPEIDSNLTYGAYPNTRQFSFGIEINF
jgi:TonB-linked outer membrane protein, SusC/RagA family